MSRESLFWITGLVLFVYLFFAGFIYWFSKRLKKSTNKKRVIILPMIFGFVLGLFILLIALSSI